MITEICVSAEELNQTLEYVSLISGAGNNKSKGKEKDAKQLSGVLKITALSLIHI